MNHFASQYRTKQVHLLEDAGQEENKDNLECYHIGNMSQSTMKMICINDKMLKMQFDTGASASIISKKFWIQLGKPKCNKCFKKLKMYDVSDLKIMGEMEAVSKFIVTASEKEHRLVGTDLIDLQNIVIPLHALKYEKFGQLQGTKATIKLKNNIKPCYFEARTLPIHIKPLAIQELYEIEMSGIITKVEGAVNGPP